MMDGVNDSQPSGPATLETLRDEQRISRVVADADTGAAIMALRANLQDAAAGTTAEDADLQIDDSHNLGISDQGSGIRPS